MTSPHDTLAEALRSWWVVHPQYWRIRITYALLGERLASHVCSWHPVRRTALMLGKRWPV